MKNRIDNNNSVPDTYIDYDIHGLVGIRLINPSPSDTTAVSRQLGPMIGQLSNEPDIIIRFVQRLPTHGLRYLGLNDAGFTKDGFFILRSSKKAAKVKVKFEHINKQSEIICESGLRSVPLLLQILNIKVLKKACVPLHASAFIYNGTGVLVTGWAKGGKSEALLSFALKGATYVGDEWIYLSSDGKNMFGIPENMRLWDWHIKQFPHVQKLISREKFFLFKAIHLLDKIQSRFSKGRIGNTFPVKYVREAMPALRRQLNVTMPPKKVFGDAFGPLGAKPEKIFLLISHEEKNTFVEPIDAMIIANRMISSISYEQLPFLEKYLAFRFAFPERSNEFIEDLRELQYEILCKALSGKEAYAVYHPYPCSFQELYEKMEPFC